MKSKARRRRSALVLDRWISTIQAQTVAETQLSIDNPTFAAQVEQQIMRVVMSMSELVHGFDFARLLTLYYRSYLND